MGNGCTVESTAEHTDIANEKNTVTLNKFGLNYAQVKYVKEAWQNVSDETQFGKRVFLKIFSLNPHIKTLFGFDASANDAALLESAKFAKHASDFSSFLHMIVDHVTGNEHVALKVCRVIGREHVRFTKHVDFDTKYWLTFTDALVQEMELELKDRYKSKTQLAIKKSMMEAMLILFESVVKTMEEAYNERKKLHGDLDA